jgi:DNA polymerase-3 subunit beta
MTIKITKSSLSEALNNVQSVVGGKSTISVLQNVKMTTKDGKVEFTCSDLDITLLARAECEVIDEGETTIPVKTFSAAVSKLVEGEIKIEVDNKDVMKLSAGQTVFKFIGLPAKDFPLLPEADGKSLTLPSNAIREMFRKTSFAASQDDTRKTLQGVCLDFASENGKVKAVATDGRRLALLDADVGSTNGFNEQYIIPRKGIDILSKKLPKDGDCTIVTTGSQICFKTAKLDFTMKLADEVYPNYMQVIPAETKEMVVADRVEVLGAIDRISVFTSATEAPCMAMAFGDNKLILTSSNTEFGEARDEVPVKYEGEKIVMKFNPQYIREALNAIDEDEIEFHLTSDKHPAVIKKGGSTDYIYVCMPLRIN